MNLLEQLLQLNVREAFAIRTNLVQEPLVVEVWKNSGTLGAICIQIPEEPAPEQFFFPSFPEAWRLSELVIGQSGLFRDGAAQEGSYLIALANSSHIWFIHNRQCFPQGKRHSDLNQFCEELSNDFIGLPTRDEAERLDLKRALEQNESELEAKVIEHEKLLAAHEEVVEKVKRNERVLEGALVINKRLESEIEYLKKELRPLMLQRVNERQADALLQFMEDKEVNKVSLNFSYDPPSVLIRNEEIVTIHYEEEWANKLKARFYIVHPNGAIFMLEETMYEGQEAVQHAPLGIRVVGTCFEFNKQDIEAVIGEPSRSGSES